jgi:hypothetical protein
MVSRELKALSKKTEKLMKAVDKLERASAAKQRKTAVKAKRTTKAKGRKPVAKKAVVRKRRAKKGAAVTATQQVLQIIQRSKKGVDVATLIKKTGLEDKPVRNIVFRAFKQGKIKRVGRGTYVAV